MAVVSLAWWLRAVVHVCAGLLSANAPRAAGSNKRANSDGGGSKGSSRGSSNNGGSNDKEGSGRKGSKKGGGSSKGSGSVGTISGEISDASLDLPDNTLGQVGGGGGAGSAGSGALLTLLLLLVLLLTLCCCPSVPAASNYSIYAPSASVLLLNIFMLLPRESTPVCVSAVSLPCVL